MTPQSIIAEVRGLIKDADATAYRNTDNDMLLYVNRALKRMAILRPDLFYIYGTITLAAGIVQTVPNYGRIVEVFGATGGGAITEAKRENLDILTPSWRTATPVTSTGLLNWMRNSRDPSRFLVSPPSDGTGTLDAEYSAPPGTYALNQTITLLESYEPVVVDITAAEVEWADDENVLNQRADAFYKRAKEVLGVDTQNRQLDDTEGGGVQGAID